MSGYAAAWIATGGGCSPPYKLEFSTRFLHIVQRHRYADVMQDNMQMSTCDFAFRVPALTESEMQNGLRCDVMDEAGNYHCYLPPSLQHRSAASPNSPPAGNFSAVKIEYGIAAQVVRRNLIVRRAFRQFNMSFSKTPAPPTCINDFPLEYLCHGRRVLRNKLFRRTGTVFVESREPTAFHFQRGNEKAISWLPLSLRLTPDAPTSWLETTGVNALITWSLQISTFLTMEKHSKHMVVSEASESIDAARIVSVVETRRLKMVFSSWTQLRPHTSDDARPSWRSDSRVMFQLSHSPMLAPTFWTPLVSRRYSIRLHIVLSGFGCSKLELVVPVQIVYDDEDGSELEDTG